MGIHLNYTVKNNSVRGFVQCKGAGVDVGVCPFEVTGNGWNDFVAGDSWYENTENQISEIAFLPISRGVWCSISWGRHPFIIKLITPFFRNRRKEIVMAPAEKSLPAFLEALENSGDLSLIDGIGRYIIC